MSGGGFCTDCGHRIESFDGLKGCPACGTTHLPCADTDQDSISVNWHELRVLVMWAENWQRQQNLGRSIYAIARRIKAQFPERIGLTFAEEIGDLAKHYDVGLTDPDLRRDVAEQTGEETQLLQPPKKEPWE